MRKSFLITALLTSLALFTTACGEEPLEEPLSQNYETIEGEFKSLAGIRVNKTITHLFEDEEGDIYYAYSDRYELNEHLDAYVEVYGLVEEYESVDKPVLEVRRITDAERDDSDNLDVNTEELKNTELGVSFEYPDNWELTEASDSILLEAPSEEDEDTEETSDEERDYIYVSQLTASLQKTAEDPEEDRVSEINTYVASSYSDLSGVSPSTNRIGPDKVLALGYKVSGGNHHYFVPRSGRLYELSFYQKSEGSGVLNANVFSNLVSSFRFLPQNGEEAEEDDSDSTDSGDDSNSADSRSGEDADAPNQELFDNDDDDESAQETSAPSGEQASVSGYASFTSKPSGFSISYPKAWYYSGVASADYDFGFAEESLEDDVDALIRLDLNASSSAGVSTSGDMVRVTVQVDGRYFTLTGPAEYQSVMQTMADSIEPYSEDEE